MCGTRTVNNAGQPGFSHSSVTCSVSGFRDMSGAGRLLCMHMHMHTRVRVEDVLQLELEFSALSLGHWGRKP